MRSKRVEDLEKAQGQSGRRITGPIGDSYSSLGKGDAPANP